MHDGRTRELDRGQTGSGGSHGAFLDRHAVSLVLLDGADAGSEFPIDAQRLVLGRGDDCDLSFDDPAMSKQHALLEFADSGYRIRDLGSRNGTSLNGNPIRSAELAHGDRLQLGEHVFQLVIEPRERHPRTYVLADRD